MSRDDNILNDISADTAALIEKPKETIARMMRENLSAINIIQSIFTHPEFLEDIIDERRFSWIANNIEHFEGEIPGLHDLLVKNALSINKSVIDDSFIVDKIMKISCLNKDPDVVPIHELFFKRIGCLYDRPPEYLLTKETFEQLLSDQSYASWNAIPRLAFKYASEEVQHHVAALISKKTAFFIDSLPKQSWEKDPSESRGLLTNWRDIIRRMVNGLPPQTLGHTTGIRNMCDLLTMESEYILSREGFEAYRGSDIVVVNHLFDLCKQRNIQRDIQGEVAFAIWIITQYAPSVSLKEDHWIQKLEDLVKTAYTDNDLMNLLGINNRNQIFFQLFKSSVEGASKSLFADTDWPMRIMKIMYEYGVQNNSVALKPEEVIQVRNNCHGSKESDAWFMAVAFREAFSKEMDAELKASMGFVELASSLKNHWPSKKPPPVSLREFNPIRKFGDPEPLWEIALRALDAKEHIIDQLKIAMLVLSIDFGKNENFELAKSIISSGERNLATNTELNLDGMIDPEVS